MDETHSPKRLVHVPLDVSCLESIYMWRLYLSSSHSRLFLTALA